MDNLFKETMLDSCSEYFFTRMSGIDPRFNPSAYLAKFHKLESVLDRFNFIDKDIKKFKLFPKITNRVKDDFKAKELRIRGNEDIKSGDYSRAFLHYTAGIMLAKSERELGYLYANRSACLFKMEKFQECIADIDRAFAHNYEGNCKKSVVERRKNAEKKQRERKKPEPYHEDIPKICPTQNHPQIKSAKNCIAIKKAEDFGKYIVATRDIQIGEVLCVENAYSSILIEGTAIHCHYCFELSHGTIPCENCSYRLYCSETCKDKAFEEYHKYECPVFGYLANYGMDEVELVALRMMILAKEHYSDPHSLLLKQGEVHESDRYKEIHHLPTDADKRSMEQMFDFTITTVYMYYLLQKHTSFFNDVTNKITFVKVFSHQLLITSLYTLRIFENAPGPINFQRESLGWGLYPFSSLFKHSCCANVDNIQYGTTMVLRALTTIKKGEQCFIDRHNIIEDEEQQPVHCQSCTNMSFLNYRRTFRIPLSTDIDMDINDFVVMTLKMASINREFAKEYLPRLQKHLKDLENKKSWSNFHRLKTLTSTCYRMFGNIRDL